MKISQLVDQSFKDRGLWGTLQVAFSYIIDYFFDIKRGTDTFSWVELDDLQIEGNHIKRGEKYQPTHALLLRKLLQELQIPREKIIVDLGSGKGKVLLVSAEYGFKEARGVEFSIELCKISENNINVFTKKYRGKTNFKVIQSDVTDYQIYDDEDVFYMFNPFDDLILSKVLSNIHASVKRNNRRVWIIYLNATHKNVIKDSQQFTQLMEYKSLGQKFLVYSNYEK